MNGPAFAACVREVLVPDIEPGTMIILDTLVTHRNKRPPPCSKRMDAGSSSCRPYAPDLNPIEQAFSKLRAHLRRIGARTVTDVFEAIGRRCNRCDPQDCRNHFKAAGYASG